MYPGCLSQTGLHEQGCWECGRAQQGCRAVPAAATCRAPSSLASRANKPPPCWQVSEPPRVQPRIIAHCAASQHLSTQAVCALRARFRAACLRAKPLLLPPLLLRAAGSYAALALQLAGVTDVQAALQVQPDPRTKHTPPAQRSSTGSVSTRAFCRLDACKGLRGALICGMLDLCASPTGCGG
jgi:hypothetical protein